ncbi:MAG: gamma-glutamylcyclotransferase [Salinibacter sp.]
MTSTPPLLATYGTLRRAFEGIERLGIADRVTFVEECQFAGILYDLGRFPGAVSGDGTVHGELLRLRDPRVWSVLDRYEGYDADREADSLFVRRRVSLQVPADQSAWVYWFNGDPTGRPQVPSGDWVAYVAGGEGP